MYKLTNATIKEGRFNPYLQLLLNCICISIWVYTWVIIVLYGIFDVKSTLKENSRSIGDFFYNGNRFQSWKFCTYLNPLQESYQLRHNGDTDSGISQPIVLSRLIVSCCHWNNAKFSKTYGRTWQEQFLVQKKYWDCGYWCCPLEHFPLVQFPFFQRSTIVFLSKV